MKMTVKLREFGYSPDGDMYSALARQDTCTGRPHILRKVCKTKWNS